MDTIYLDHNSTTPVLAEVAAAMHDCWLAGPANPASQHQFGRRARQRIEDARESIGRLLGARMECFDGDRVIFTSGGTEANHLALLGLVRAEPGHVIISAIEHPSLNGAAQRLTEQGFVVDRTPVDRRGVIDLAELERMLRPDTQLVSVMLANNETGVLQPVGEIVACCAARGIPVHTDAAQAAGKLSIDFAALGVAAMTVAAHKLHGPVGIGALVVRHGVEVKPLWVGGVQQSGLRPGTESVALAVGFEKALSLWYEQRADRVRRMTSLRNRFEAGLLTECPELVVHGGDAPRLPHTTNLAFPKADRQALLIALDLAGVACSSGSACASGSSEPSPVLLAMGVDRALVKGSLRFSLGATTTPEEIDEAVHRIVRVYRQLGGKKPLGKTHLAGTGASLEPL